MSKKFLLIPMASIISLNTFHTNILKKIIHATNIDNSISNNSNRIYSTDIPTAINAGTYNVYYKVICENENYQDPEEKIISVIIEKATPTVTAPTPKELTYNSESQQLIEQGNTNGGTLQYSLDGINFSEEIPTAINANEIGADGTGGYTVYYKSVGNDNYNNSEINSIKVAIAKATPTVTAPTPKELTYNSESQQLIEQGNTNGGTLQYSLDGINFSEEIPTAINANEIGADGTGGYTVYYKSIGNDNYNNSEINSIKVAIAKATPTVTAPTPKELTYNSESQQLIEQGNTNGGTLQYSLDGINFSEEIPTAINANEIGADGTGGYTVYYKSIGNDNYNNSEINSIKVAIAKATPTVTAPTSKELTYNSESQQLIEQGNTNGGTLQYSLDGINFSEEIPTAINANEIGADGTGGYTVYYKSIGNDNYNNSEINSVKVAIAKATPTVTAPTPKELTYNSESQQLIEQGNTNGGTLQYSLDGTNFSEEIPTAINANEIGADGTGGYTVYYKSIGNDNYNNSEINSIKVAIAKATPTVTAPTPKELTYNSESQQLIEQGNTNGGTLQYSLDGINFSEEIPTAINANEIGADGTGGYTVYYKSVGNDNYNNSEINSIKVAIAKATPTVTAPIAKKNLLYNGKTQELVTRGSTTFGELLYSLDDQNYTKNIPTGTNVDSYTVFYKVEGTDNYNEFQKKKITVQIYNAAQQAPPAPQAKTKSEYSITLNPLEPNENGANPQYKKDNGDWQESNVFKSLIPNKEYTFYTRYNATEDGNFAPSLPSEPTKIRTLKKNDSNFENDEENSNTNDENNNDNSNANNGANDENSNGNEDDKNNDEDIKTNSNEIIISDKIQQIETENGIANIETKRSDNNIEIKITDENGNLITIPEGITLIAACDSCKPGTVAVIINDDGTIKVIRKSVVKDGKIYIPLNSSAKLEIIDNYKIFYDVPTNHWAHDAVTFVSSHELFNGTVPNIFEPETPMSRAMIVQVLHNLEDNPKQAFEKIFSDVNIGDWFAEAVTWASKNNFILGYDDKKFGPNDSIIREQLATILYRYFGDNEIVDANLNFVDTNQISDYALKALKWAVKYEIIQGKGNNILDSKGLATRAEVAQMFQNLMLNLFYR